ncbi:outer membrane beta-barrel protein [Oleiharenicola lentus]|uniref:outer membrane beta-barrel protein n=1 Tax=Oleiharenicola lentus TaxID=2508720 RepID=UPI003F66175A
MITPSSPFSIWCSLAQKILRAASCVLAWTLVMSVHAATAPDGRALAEQVREIANETGTSRAKKEKRISNAVRVATVAATAYQTESSKISAVALEFAERAAAAAPKFSETIGSAVAFTPAVTKIDGMTARVRATAAAAAKLPAPRYEAVAAAPAGASRARTLTPETVAVAPHVNVEYAPVAQARAPAIQEEVERAASPRVGSARDGDTGLKATDVVLSRRYRLHATLDVGARYDDNVYLNHGDEADDVIATVAPGIDFAWGERANAHGALAYRHAFQHYLDDTSENVNLGRGSAAFGFIGNRLSFQSSAAFQQSNQNNGDVAVLGENAAFRRDQLNLGAASAFSISEKTSVNAGVEYDQVRYRSDTFSGSEAVSLPVRLFWKTSAKLEVGGGATYRVEEPQRVGAKAKDWFYNLGAKGDFTERLTGRFFVGYRTREVEGFERDDGLGLEGGFDYRASAKSRLALSLSRDFALGARGESVTRSRYALRWISTPTPFLRFEVGSTYQASDYGASIFTGNPNLARTDDFWSGDVSMAYSFNQWISTSLDYLFRNNQSSIATAEFSNNILSWNWQLRY